MRKSHVRHNVHLKHSSNNRIEWKKLKEEIDKYIKTGEPFKGEIEIPALGRTASVVFPRESSKDVTITLKVTTKSQTT